MAGHAQLLEATLAMGAALWLLAFLLGCSGTYAEPQNSEEPAVPKCSLAGTWVNELGSRMTIAPTNNPEEFQGSYLTAVSATDSAIQRSPLKGFQHHVDQRAQPTFGFTVHWSFSNSITAFTGQCFLNAGGREQLQTTWLLRSEVGSISEDWGATRVGTNTFHRIS